MIEVKNLSKAYLKGRSCNNPAKATIAGLKRVTFHVQDGEVFGLLGPNGSGKTTTIRHLMGFIKPDTGHARIKELDCWRDSKEVKALVGYLPGEMNFLKEMSGLEFLDLMAGMHGDRPDFRRRRNQLAERMDLSLKQPIKKMSKGMKQKLGIINTMMLDSEVLILDEPTSGLDPLMQKVFIELVLEEKSRGKTILISSHLFPEIERTCDRVGILRAGQLVAVEGIQKLRQEQKRTFEITLETSEQAQLICQSGLKASIINDNQVSVEIQGDLNPFFRVLAELQVEDFTQKMTELEEAFMQFYERGDDF